MKMKRMSGKRPKMGMKRRVGRGGRKGFNNLARPKSKALR